MKATRLPALRKDIEAALKVTAAHSGGLAWCKDDADLFRSLGIGREITFRKKGNQTLKTWWVPRDLLDLNRTLTAGGVSRKLRRRTIQFVLEGKPLPRKADTALALYAESLVSQP